MLKISKEVFEAAGLAEQLEHYCHLLELEFRGLDQHELYQLVFSRLLKPDPFRTLADAVACGDRPTMLGADERDALLPALKNLFVRRDAPVTIMDLGAGDGQTVALALDHVPDGSRFYLEEPNVSYAGHYEKLIESVGRDLVVAEVSHETIDEYCHRLNRDETAHPAPGTVDVLLAIHMVYFVSDLAATVNFMLDRLRPGGQAFIVFADARRGFTGKCFANFAKTADAQRYRAHQAAQQELAHLFALNGDGARGAATEKLRQRLGRSDVEVVVNTDPTRLFGNDLGDLLALGFLTGLGGLAGDSIRDKIASVKDLISRDPAAVELALETSGPREGMWSVLEPQYVIVITRLSQ